MAETSRDGRTFSKITAATIRHGGEREEEEKEEKEEEEREDLVEEDLYDVEALREDDAIAAKN